MPPPINVFLDTSALFAAIWSAQGGGREILRLGELGLLRLWVSSRVLQELESAVRRKAPTVWGTLTLLLDRCNIEVVARPSGDITQRCQELIRHRGDAEVLAAAWHAGVDYFVTLDQRHFLSNPALLEHVPFPLGTPGDFLWWYREHLRALVSDDEGQS